MTSWCSCTLSGGGLDPGPGREAAHVAEGDRLLLQRGGGAEEAARAARTQMHREIFTFSQCFLSGDEAWSAALCRGDKMGFVFQNKQRFATVGDEERRWKVSGKCFCVQFNITQCKTTGI